MIRIALAGCGEHSRASHAAPLARFAAAHPNEIKLVAACDLNRERALEFCHSFGFARAYEDLDQMLEVEQPDACVSVMPMEKIGEVGIKLLQRRIPCVIEKPLGTSLPEIERLAGVARETQTPHMVSVNRRFMPYLNQARSWMQQHGPLRYVRASQVRHQRSEPDFIWSTAIHAIDALRYIAGEVERFDVTLPQAGTSGATWYVISLRFESGTTGQVEILPTAGMVEESYELFGEGCRARVTAGSGTQRLLECWEDGERVIVSHATEDEPEDLRNGAYQEVEEFVRALRTGSRPQPSIDDILPSARISFAIADMVGNSQP
ncbi:MAG TPA: Gfo/Idh/MocA family oxidoreductase [Pyrinomonadaceae bacterium]|nr:Gfo/Idh/MocA family oxidoreductase [Pyrinomonadaceae bacterium]